MTFCSTAMIFISLSFLICLYICSIALGIIYIISQNNNIIFILSLTDVSISFIMIIITILLGFIPVYFSLKDKLYIYIIILLFIFGFKIFDVIILFMEEDKQNELLLFISKIIIINEIFLLLLNFLLCACFLIKLIREVEESPLNYVDETITEEMYNNILSQCLNPDDKKLKLDFQKKLENRKSEVSRMSRLSRLSRLTLGNKNLKI